MPKHYADTTRNPDTMTADERGDEVAGILARGIARALRAIAAADLRNPENLAEEGETCLEVPDDPGLSVALRPGGEGPGLACPRNEEPR